MNKDTLKKEEKPKLERCGWCGVFISDTNEYTQEEYDNAELTSCGCRERENEFEPTPREMYEAGIISRSEYENL